MSPRLENKGCEDGDGKNTRHLRVVPPPLCLSYGLVLATAGRRDRINLVLI